MMSLVAVGNGNNLTRFVTISISVFTVQAITNGQSFPIHVVRPKDEGWAAFIHFG